MAFFDISYVKDGTLCLDNFISNGELWIGARYWQEIKEAFDEELIRRCLVETIQDNDLPLPGMLTDESVLYKGVRYLQELDSGSLVRRAKDGLITRKEYEWPLTSYYIQGGVGGNVVSDYFHRKERFKCGTFKFASPEEVWNDPDKLFYSLRALWTMKIAAVSPTTLRNCLSLRFYEASQFRVTAAMALYDLFGAEDVLDTSMGWGDRLAGFCFSKTGKRYYGFDPNHRLHKGYAAQMELYGQDKEAFWFEASPSEDAFYPSEAFDFAFTSPPYFETERYGRAGDKEQSWVRYKEVESWLENYLFATISNIWKALKPNGVLALNIADLGVSYESTDICDPMNRFISELDGAEYVGCLGLRLSSRPHTSLVKRTKAGEKAVFVEPIWVWSKGEAITLDEVVEKLYSRGGIEWKPKN